MKKFLLSIVAALLCVTVQADDIIVYKHNFTVTRTGAGQLLKTKVTGWTIINGQTAEMALVEVEPARKRFKVEQPSYRVESVSAPLGKSLTAFAVDSGQLTGLTIKGTDKIGVDIWVLTYYDIPLRATIGGSDLYQLGGDDYFLDEYKGSLVYDKANTSTPFNRTVAEKLAQFREQLAALGYIEEI